jgi:hypothetical protein
MGTVVDTSTESGHGEHYWIVLPMHKRFIDYRATWWLTGSNVPNGIFDPAACPNMDYQPLAPEEAVLPPALIKGLLTPGPRPIAEITVGSLSEGDVTALARYQLAHDGSGERTLNLPAMTRALSITGTQDLALFFPAGDFLVLDRASGHLTTASERVARLRPTSARASVCCVRTIDNFCCLLIVVASACWTTWLETTIPMLAGRIQQKPKDRSVAGESWGLPWPPWHWDGIWYQAERAWQQRR